MKRNSIKNAVESVKWTDEQRMTIEARLRVPLHHPEDIEDGFTESVTAISRVLPREENEMETKKRPKKKILVIAALAAALSVGGVTAGVAMRGHNPNGETVTQDETTQPTTEQDISNKLQELKGTLGIRFSGGSGHNFAWNKSKIPSFIWMAKSETGWYYNAIIENAAEGGICYSDDETGSKVPLCARPQCKHDGNEYCTATQTKYNVRNLVYDNGWLYGAAYQQDTQHCVILRYAPDGTEIKVLADLGECAYYDLCTVLYRGNLIILAPLTNGTYLAEGGTTQPSKGFQFIAYELATGKQTVIYSCMPEKNASSTRQPGNQFWCANDCIYYYQPDSLCPELRQGYYKISMLDGSVEKIFGGEVMILAASEHHVLYSRKENGFAYKEALYLADPDCKNPVEVGTKPEITNGKHTFALDDEYIYELVSEYATNNASVNVYDHSYKLLGTVSLPEHVECHAIYAENGTLYCWQDHAVMDPAKTVKATGINPMDGSTFEYDDIPVEFIEGYVTSCKGKDVAEGSGKLEPVFRWCEKITPKE